MEIWYESHATTLDNEVHRASGWNDVDLSEMGKRQAEDLVERCKERGIQAIFCSDLQRAVKTAIPTADALHIPLYPDVRLRECNYGDMAGMSTAEMEAEKPKRVAVRFPNGQSYDECIADMRSFFDELKQCNYEKVLIIGHRATQYGLEVYVNDRTLEECMDLPADYWTGADKPGKRYSI